MKRETKKFKGELCLLLASLIWGSAFIFQKAGMDYVGPFTFSFFRFFLGALALLPVIQAMSFLNKKYTFAKKVTTFSNKTLWAGALFGGLANFAAGSLQQVGIVYTTAGKAGFLTAMDIVIVPLLMLFLRQKVGKMTWIGIAMSAVGLYLLCITEGFSLQPGDGLVLGCAVAYSFQILIIDYYAERVDPVRLSFLMFMLAGILSGVAAAFFETIELQAVLDCAVPILYVAILEVSIAFTLQIVGQRYTPPALAAIIMSLESVFAAVCGGIFLGESMSDRELTGCAIMFAAFVISQLPDRKSGQKDKQE